MRRNYGTHLSPKNYAEINTLDYGIRSVLTENYVKRIARYHKVDFYKLEHVYSTVYGSDWVNTDYKKLRQIAKAMPHIANVREDYYEPRAVSNNVLLDYRTKFTKLDDSYAYRRAVRVFGKKRVMECYSDNNRCRADELARAVLGYRIVKEIDGKLMADIMKKRIPTLANIYRSYSDNTRTYRYDDIYDMLPENISSDIRKLAKEYAVLSCESCHGSSSYTNMTNRILRNIRNKADAVRYNRDYDKSMLDAAMDKLSHAVSDMYAMRELDEALGTVGLEIDKHRTYYETEPRRYSTTKIEPKLIRAVNTVLSTNYDDAAKRDMLNDIVGKMLSERGSKGNRTYWLPLLAIKSEERK